MPSSRETREVAQRSNASAAAAARCVTRALQNVEGAVTYHKRHDFYHMITWFMSSVRIVDP